MKNILKWSGVLLGSLLGLFIVATAVVYLMSNQAVGARYDIQPVALSIPEPDSAMLARGEHVSRIRACSGCHGKDLGGKVMVDDPAFGTISSANITRGEGSAIAAYSDEDWVRTIRHGVRPDGQPVLIMPSQEFIQLGREDLVSLIAYVKQVPPVDRVHTAPSLGPMARMLMLVDKNFPLLHVEKVDHATPLSDAPTPAVNVEFGRYIATSCTGCHGPDLATPQGGPPDAPPPADLTSLSGWSEGDFMRAVREGIRPNGDTLHTFMPRWTSPTDVELRAVWAYVHSIQTGAE
jgi:mono/diheme cytochrome c family protein